MSFGYIKSLPSTEYVRYLKKLEIIGLEECPYNFPADSWDNNPTKWPELLFPDIVNYLIETPGVYTMESMRNYKSLEAYNYFISGWVQTVYHFNVGTTKNVVLKADVRPSMRVNNEPHHPWVALKKDGRVIAAHCDCMAGLGESCSHVGALLFKLECAVRHGHTRQACTEKPCAWNQCFTKSVQPAPITEIKFYKEKSKEKLTMSKRQRKAPPPPYSKDKQLNFLLKLADSGEKQVGLCSFKETAHLFEDKNKVERLRLPTKMSSLFSEKNSELSEDELKNKLPQILKDVKISEKQNNFLMESSNKQADSLVWHEQRSGRITASNAHSVLKTNMDQPAQSLIKKICHPNSKPLNVPAINWGKENEKVAIDEYVGAMSTQHSDFNCKSVGLGLSVEKPFIGASPDGLISCSCCGAGVLEIKCPFSHKDSSHEDLLSDSTFCVNKEYQLKQDNSYYSQVQLQMHVFDKQFCDFVVWTTQTCVITRVNKDTDFINEMVEKLEKFWIKHCLPELLTHNLLKTSKPIMPVPSKENKGSLFCYCQKSWDENDGTDMIGCDNPNCKYQWIHLQCAKLKRVKKGKWYCKDCKKMNK